MLSLEIVLLMHAVILLVVRFSIQLTDKGQLDYYEEGKERAWAKIKVSCDLPIGQRVWAGKVDHIAPFSADFHQYSYIWTPIAEIVFKDRSTAPFAVKTVRFKGI